MRRESDEPWDLKLGFVTHYPISALKVLKWSKPLDVLGGFVLHFGTTRARLHCRNRANTPIDRVLNGPFPEPHS